MKKHVVLLLSLVGMLMIGASLQAKDKVVVIPLSGGKQVSNIVTVAKSGGDFTDLQEAIDSISDAREDNPYLIVIGPGRYEVEQTITTKDYVIITGSGRDVTTLVGKLGTSSIEPSPIIRCAPHTSTTLSNIAVGNYGNDQIHTKFSVAIYCENHAGMYLENVDVMAQPGLEGSDFTRAVYNENHSFISLENVILTITGFNTEGVVLYNSDDSRCRVNNSKMQGSGHSGVRIGHSGTEIINTRIEGGVIDTSPEKQCLYTYDSQLKEIDC